MKERARAAVAVDSVKARASIQTRQRSAFVNIRLARRTRVAGRAIARVSPVGVRATRAALSARIRLTGDARLALRARPTDVTVARISVDSVDASTAVRARIQLAVVDLDFALATREASQRAIARVVADEIGADAPISAGRRETLIVDLLAKIAKVAVLAEASVACANRLFLTYRAVLTRRRSARIVQGGNTLNNDDEKDRYENPYQNEIRLLEDECVQL